MASSVRSMRDMMATPHLAFPRTQASHVTAVEVSLTPGDGAFSAMSTIRPTPARIVAPIHAAPAGFDVQELHADGPIRTSP